MNEAEEPVSDQVEGRKEVLETVRSGRTIDKLFLQEGVRDDTISEILQKVKEQGTVVTWVPKQRLDQMSESGHHQGVIARTAAFHYSELEDAFRLADERKEDPFLILLDEIEDPHNLGAIIRTANLAGAHGVIVPRRRSSGLTSVVIRASAGAVNYTPVIRVTNLSRTIEDLKKRGLWFACAAMDGQSVYQSDLKGPLGLVIGNEGKGVSRLVREKCDFTVSIPMHGDIDSLNASVAAGILAFEAARQRATAR